MNMKQSPSNVSGEDIKRTEYEYKVGMRVDYDLESNKRKCFEGSIAVEHHRAQNFIFFGDYGELSMRD
jgi:hypothetical protein